MDPELIQSANKKCRASSVLASYRITIGITVILTSYFGFWSSDLWGDNISVVAMDQVWPRDVLGDVKCPPNPALAVQADGKILVAGNDQPKGDDGHGFVRLNNDGTLDKEFKSDVHGQVLTVAVQMNGQILIGGNFSNLHGASFKNLARCNGDGGVDKTFFPNPDKVVRCIALQTDGKILIGGEFRNLGIGLRRYLARINVDGKLDFKFNTNVDGTVTTVFIQEDGKIVIGGDFLTVNGQKRNRIARLNVDGTLDALFNPDADRSVRCVTAQADGKLLVGGDFVTIGAKSANQLARLNGDGTLNQFQCVASDIPSEYSLFTIVNQVDQKIKLGGGFKITTVGGFFPMKIRGAPAGVTATEGTGPSIALQADGKLLSAGNIFGARRGYIMRQRVVLPASQTLSISDLTRITLTRTGTAPEVSQVLFEVSSGISNKWLELGYGKRIGDTGHWQLNGLSLPNKGVIRALGRTTNGGTGAGIVEVTQSYAIVPAAK